MPFAFIYLPPEFLLHLGCTCSFLLLVITAHLKKKSPQQLYSVNVYTVDFFITEPFNTTCSAVYSAWKYYTGY